MKGSSFQTLPHARKSCRKSCQIPLTVAFKGKCSLGKVETAEWAVPSFDLRRPAWNIFLRSHTNSQGGKSGYTRIPCKYLEQRGSWQLLPLCNARCQKCSIQSRGERKSPGSWTTNQLRMECLNKLLLLLPTFRPPPAAKSKSTQIRPPVCPSHSFCPRLFSDGDLWRSHFAFFRERFSKFLPLTLP